jgi:hypothetical protein
MKVGRKRTMQDRQKLNKLWENVPIEARTNVELYLKRISKEKLGNLSKQIVAEHNLEIPKPTRLETRQRKALICWFVRYWPVAKCYVDKLKFPDLESGMIDNFDPDIDDFSSIDWDESP